MLRLTRIADTQATQNIKLEGKLLEPWVDEVRRACAADTGPSSRISLDLSALTFADAAGEGLLRDLIGGGAEVVACSIYIAELLGSRAGARQKGGYKDRGMVTPGNVPADSSTTENQLRVSDI